jgi:hypothetical protein
VEVQQHIFYIMVVVHQDMLHMFKVLYLLIFWRVLVAFLLAQHLDLKCIIIYYLPIIMGLWTQLWLTAELQISQL